MLEQGDLLLFPRSHKHQISVSDEPQPMRPTSPHDTYADGVLPGSTGLLCGLLELENVQRNPLLDELPDVWIMRYQQDQHEWLTPLLTMLSRELTDDSAGRDAVVNKLADVLFIQVIRDYMRHHQPNTGVIAALQDAQLHQALTLIHEDVAGNWTLESLAGEVGLSRSVFAERFKQVIGDTPMQYLLQWRMQRALHWLKDDKLSVMAVAERCGYQSDAAFSKSFKKVHGYGPGEARRGL